MFRFGEKKGYLVNGLLTVPMQKLKDEYKENQSAIKMYYIIKEKQKKGIKLLQQEEIFIRLKAKNIIWKDVE